MKYTLILSFIILLMSCKKAIHQNNEITKVELARGGAWFDFGATISVDSSLNYKYFGDYGKVKQGYFTGKVSHQFWDTLNQKFEEVKFKTVPPYSKIVLLDADYFELIIYWRNGKRKITRYWDGEQEPVIAVFNWLDSSYKSTRLKQVNNPFKFETTAHRQLKPKVDRSKFPPPIIKNSK
jgi:hypothetical protein